MENDVSLGGLISLVVACVVLFAVGWVILWLCRNVGMPGDLYNVVQIVVWVIVGAAILYRLLAFAGVA